MFNQVWTKIEQYQGEVFHTKRGLPFTYSIRNRYIIPNRARQQLIDSYVEAVWAMGRLEGPGDIRERDRRIRGTTYIWAILHDPRITG